MEMLRNEKMQENYCPVVKVNVLFSLRNVDVCGHLCSNFKICSERDGGCCNKYVPNP